MKLYDKDKDRHWKTWHNHQILLPIITSYIGLVRLALVLFEFLFITKILTSNFISTNCQNSFNVYTTKLQINNLELGDLN